MLRQAIAWLCAAALVIAGCGPAFAGPPWSVSAPPILPGITLAVNTAATDTTTASNNAAAINAALAQGRRVYVTGQGVACIGAALVVYSNDDLQVEPGLKLRACSNIASRLITTHNATQMGSGVTVTTTWTAGRQASIAYASHGLSVGDWVWIWNASGATAPAGQTAFIGVFPVISITDANDFVVRLKETPTANASYTLKALKADHDISIHGAFDYNQPTNGGSGPDTQLAVLAGAANILADITCYNAYKYCMTMEGVANWHAGLYTPISNSDGIKVYGPAFDGEILHADCDNGDDCVSLQPKEATGFLTYPLTEGDIVGVRGGNIQQVWMQSGTANTLALYAHSIYNLDDININGVSGDNEVGQGVFVRNSPDQNTTSQMGRISITGITDRAVAPLVVQQVGGGAMTIASATFELNNTEVTGTGSHITVQSGVNFNELILKPTLINTSFANTYAVVNGSANHVTIDHPNLQLAIGSAAAILFTGNGANTFSEIEVNGGSITAKTAIGTYPGATFAATPQFYIHGAYINAATDFDVRAASDVNFVNDTLSGSFSVIRFDAAVATKLRASGNVLLGSTPWITAPSAGTIYPYSDEAQLDVTQTYVGRAIGEHVYNTNASAGTLGQAGVVDSLTAATGGWHLRGSSGTPAY